MCWGTGDFCGGLASRSSRVLAVLLFSQAVGGLLLTAFGLLLGLGQPDPREIAFGAGAGLFGLAGLLALYQGFSLGRMGIVSPLSALIAVILPVIYGMLTQGPPRTLQVVGFAAALLSIWLLSFTGMRIGAERRVIVLALLSGSCFGLFFVLLGTAAQEAVLWPIITARWVAVLLLVLFLPLKGEPLLPSVRALPLVGLAGVLDTAGNVFFALAARAGRLDISVVVSSLFPAVTVLLALLFLKERLSLRQWSGVLSALAAIALITL
jgi:drug/metabolite transporter (DMT)-like permease